MTHDVRDATVADVEPGVVPAATARDVVAMPTGTPVPLDPIAQQGPPHNPAPDVGSTIKHYELLRKRGEGGMGTVYVARDTTLGRLVAIKVLKIQAGPSAERFLIEAQATARCRHDNIVVIYEVGELDGHPYMVLEYLEGRTLEGLLWRDQAAREATEWLTCRRAEQGAEESLGLDKREERFLIAVVALSERGRRRRQRIVAGVLATVSVIAVAVFLLSIGMKRQATRADREAAQAAQAAEEAAKAAQDEARQARNATRMAAARELEQDPTTVLAPLREVEQPGMPRGWAELVSNALRSGLAREVRDWGVPVASAAWSPDGQRIVAALSDGTARVWKADDAAEPIVLRGHKPWVVSAAFSPDGTRILTASKDKTTRVWSSVAI